MKERVFGDHLDMFVVIANSSSFAYVAYLTVSDGSEFVPRRENDT